MATKKPRLPRERDLRLSNENHEEVAAAMGACRSPRAECFRDGRCEYGGDCFRGLVAIHTDDLREIRDSIEKLRAIIVDLHHAVRKGLR